jgi:hypothetical protein
MNTFKKTLATGALLASLAGGAVAFSATSASAYVACNRYGECWRVRERYTTYPNTLGMVFYDDAWWQQHRHNHHYHWRKDRDDDDRGYYLHGHWRTFG